MVNTKARGGKGKGKEDEDLEREKKWITENFLRLQEFELREKRLVKQLEEEIASGSYFECGCCYGDTGFSQLGTDSLTFSLSTSPFVKRTPSLEFHPSPIAHPHLCSHSTVICSEGCQFCRDCAIMNAETQIGMRKFVSFRSPLCLRSSEYLHSVETDPSYYDRTDLTLHVDVGLCKFFPRSRDRQIPLSQVKGSSA